MDRKAHWESVYRRVGPSEVSWYQAEARLSFGWIRKLAPETADPIIDVGGGASVLVDELCTAGYTNVTVLDLAATALDRAQDRLGPRGSGVSWVEADVLSAALPAGAFAFWHDRAVFHFLTDPGDRARYVAQVRSAVRPGGHVLIATFAADGPTRCSGLDVMGTPRRSCRPNLAGALS
jgi:SAM-dependent methyltransferase